MLTAVAIVALVVSAACAIAAVLSGFMSPGNNGEGTTAKRPQTQATRRAQVSWLIAAFAFLTLAAAVAAVDAKVAAAAPSAAPDSEPASTTTSGPAPSWPLAELANFEGEATLHADPVAAPGLCLVRYFPRSRVADPGATWWTTCEENRTLRTVAQVRQRLALPREWGTRDARVIANIPAGETIVYLRGRASRQCEPSGAPCYAGGGEQLLFREADFDRSWVEDPQCNATGGERARAKWGPCSP